MKTHPHLKDNSLLISSKKSSFTRCSYQIHTNSRPIQVYSSRIQVYRRSKMSKVFGVYLDPSLSFNKHSHYGAESVSRRNNLLKALAGTSWELEKETLLMIYKAVGRSIINYAALICSPNLHDANYRKIQYTQKEALRISTSCHNMSSITYTQKQIC